MKKKVIIVFMFICFISLALFLVFNFIILPKTHQEIVSKYSKEYGLEKEFVFAIIKAESDFDEKAVSKSGAKGLMQLMPRTANWIAGEVGDKIFIEDYLFDPETNIKFGCFYLNYLFSKFKEMETVICAYNAGETIVRMWLDESGKLDKSKIAYEETKVYLERVLKFYDMYKKY